MTSKRLQKIENGIHKIVSTRTRRVAQEFLNEFRIYGCHQIVNIMKNSLRIIKQYLQNQIIKKQQRQAAKRINCRF